MSSIRDFYVSDPAEGRTERYSVPLTGGRLSIGPFPFRPRSVIVMNQTGTNVIVEDDRGEQYVAASQVAATYGLGDTVRLQAWLDAAQTAGKATVVVSDQPAGVAAAQLSSLSPRGSNVLQLVALANFPPGGAQDGDLVALQPDPTAPQILWLLRFNSGSSSPYKWEYLGGSPIEVQNGLDEILTAVNAWADTTPNAGPGIIVPRAGDYRALWSASGYNLSGSTQFNSGIGRGNVTPTNSVRSDTVSTQVTLQTGDHSPVEAAATLAAVPGGTELRLRYFQTAGVAANAHVFARILKIEPIRIG